MSRPQILALVLVCIGACVNADDSSGNNEAGGASEALPTNEVLQQKYYADFGIRCIDQLVTHSGTENTAFPKTKAFGAPTGAGQNAGSLDVFVVGDAQEAVLQAGGFTADNGAGVDIKVFENGFETSGAPGTYAWDLATLEVSPDNTNWYGFAPGHDGAPNNQPSAGKLRMVGLKPVITNYVSNAIDPRSAAAGGDDFELSDAKLITDRSSGNPTTFAYGASLAQKVRYFRIIDGSAALPDDQVASNGVDIDAICFFHPVAD